MSIDGTRTLAGHGLSRMTAEVYAAAPQSAENDIQIGHGKGQGMGRMGTTSMIGGEIGIRSGAVRGDLKAGIVGKGTGGTAVEVKMIDTTDGIDDDADGHCLFILLQVYISEHYAYAEGASAPLWDCNARYPYFLGFE